VPKVTDRDVALLHALADPARLAIIRQLARDGRVCACDFSAGGGLAQPTISYHLRVLREAGVVRGERRGTWISYALQPGVAERLRALAGELLPGSPRPASLLAGGTRRDRRSRSHPTGLQ